MIPQIAQEKFKVEEFLEKNGWKEEKTESYDDYNSWIKDGIPISVDINNEEFVFVDDSGDFLHETINYYALIGALIDNRIIGIGYKSV